MSRFSPPATPDRFDKNEHLDRLLAFVHPKMEQNVETSFGTSDGCKVEAVVVLDGDTAGKVHRDTLLFGNLGDTLNSSVGNIILGRLVKGRAKPGYSAPWILDAPTDDDVATADRWFDRNSTEIDGHIVVTEPDDEADAF
jgi:hypothetical protein